MHQRDSALLIAMRLVSNSSPNILQMCEVIHSLAQLYMAYSIHLQMKSTMLRCDPVHQRSKRGADRAVNFTCDTSPNAGPSSWVYKYLVSQEP